MVKAGHPRPASQRGGLLIYFAVLLLPILIGAGIALELGRAYLIKAHLAKAVDAAALAAAQAIGDGQVAARTAAERIFTANFPNGYLGTVSVQNPPNVTFATGADNSTIATVSSSASLDNSFTRVVGFPQYTVGGRGQTTRRTVDVSFVVDHSGSLATVWDEVQTDLAQFVKYFDPAVDRMSLVTFSSDTVVKEAMNNGRGFNRNAILADIASETSNGNTATAEGLYQGWDQLRTVPNGGQSSLRIIVLFTDGAPNTFSAQFNLGYGALKTGDFPAMGGTSSDSPNLCGLIDPYAAGSDSIGCVPDSPSTFDTKQLGNLLMPSQSLHKHHMSSGIPDGFLLIDPTLPGGRRVLIPGAPATVASANNAARNLAEIVANAARNDASGAHSIRIYALGLGQLLEKNLGPEKETGSSMLKRIANDQRSPDYNSAQPEGKYYFASDTDELAAAFEAVRNQVIRLSE